MKQLKPFCLFFILTVASCNKDKERSLPPETQYGAGTFGCKINGRVWVPNGSDAYSGQNIGAIYQHIYTGASGFVFSIHASKYNNNPLEVLQLIIDSVKLFQGIKIPLAFDRLGESGQGRFAKYASNADVQFRTTDLLKGELQIDKFNEVDLIVSGTFWFDAIDRDGNIIHVTEGRFDVKYTR